MQSQYEKIWQNWAKKLQQLGLHEFAAAIFRASGPFNLVGAQLIYVTQPVLNTFVQNDNLNALATLLEEPKYSKSFLEDLLEEN
ncbi:MAG: hypothetical protein HON98_04640 [Chloroflexi bacterium]|jgi:hypothetical protein|nr:hypothetical protein [Chloroflexota bacterium]MBT3671174.1 hypothetical protein [Chloroflexota bacterium]MBT4002545.1 hypothetical protein [Chloroflexota bacterium]MBT4304367.1 hypothetical protein [Chloroflexota bacterium]MBT4534386.1 hypothetical protein [Chloroflexota bacterium]